MKTADQDVAAQQLGTRERNIKNNRAQNRKYEEGRMMRIQRGRYKMERRNGRGEGMGRQERMRWVRVYIVLESDPCVRKVNKIL